MQFTEDGKPSDHMIDVEERSPAHVEAWILVELLHRGVDRYKFSKDLPYDTSKMMSGDAIEFCPTEYQAELLQLSHWYRNAVGALKKAATTLASEDETPPILVEPQNLRLEIAVGDRVLGFSSGDLDRVGPYFFVAQADKEFGTSAEIVKVLEVSSKTTMDQVEEFLTTAPTPSSH
ncbi:hypothetical protein [Methyloligella halotolerans]|nr:hypothetical protein [Methyloligella halotolerans]